eukprot:scaffold47449_cov110-Phaeocystis_antarctica.AAC.5
MFVSGRPKSSAESIMLLPACRAVTRACTNSPQPCLATASPQLGEEVRAVLVSFCRAFSSLLLQRKCAAAAASRCIPDASPGVSKPSFCSVPAKLATAACRLLEAILCGPTWRIAKGLRRAARASIHQSAAFSLSAAVALVPRSDCPNQKPTVNRHSNSARRSKTGASCSRHFLSLSSVSTFGSSQESITTTGSLRYLCVYGMRCTCEALLTENAPTARSICS